MFVMMNPCLIRMFVMIVTKMWLPLQFGLGSDVNKISCFVWKPITSTFLFIWETVFDHVENQWKLCSFSLMKNYLYLLLSWKISIPMMMLWIPSVDFKNYVYLHIEEVGVLSRSNVPSMRMNPSTISYHPHYHHPSWQWSRCSWCILKQCILLGRL